MALSVKQGAFVEAYLTHFNATQAAKEAGYRAKDDHSFASIGYENLRKLEIKEAIKARLNESAMTADEVLMRLAEQARGNLGDVFRIVDYPVTREEIDEETGESKTVTVGYKRQAVLDMVYAIENGRSHLIKSYSETQHGERVEMYDAQAALVQIGRAHGLFVDKQEHTGPGGGPIQVDSKTLAEATQELSEWRKQQADTLLNGSSALLTQAISPTSTE